MWNDGVLTQTVDLDTPDIEFPVLMDPAWSYTHSTDVINHSPTQIRNKLKGCFNCFFPVEGAPSAYPKFNTYLPLKVRPFVGSPIWWDFSCWFDVEGYEVFDGLPYFSYRFRASSTHVDGAGSSIAFDFNPIVKPGDSKVRTVLVVSGYVVNSDPIGTGQPAYTFAASATWNQFAYNLEYF